MTSSQRYLYHLSPVIVAGRTVKRYHLTTDHTPVPEAIRHAAYRYLPHLLPDTRHPTLATVSILHVGQNTVHLNAYTWTDNQRIDRHTATARRSHPHQIGFTRVDNPTGCLWELPALVHERSAWARHVTDTNTPNIDDYLDDVLAGVPATM